MGPTGASPQYAHITGGFLKRYQDVVAGQMLHYQWEVMNDRAEGAAPSGAIRNVEIAAGLREGAHTGGPWQDSDIAKWIEACALSLTHHPDAELEKNCDFVIDLIRQAQMEDGYFVTYYQIRDISKRWTNVRDRHEMYNVGHFAEAAVAYSQATGKDMLLEIVERMVDHITTVFGPGKKRAYPGHPELELGLIKLYRHTGQAKYLELAQYFVDERGAEPNYFDIEAKARGDEGPPWYGGHNYCQSHMPVRQQRQATGHAVLALYLYSIMADMALETGDEALLAACRALWQNVTETQMYVTGAVGQDHENESFSLAYDLPGDAVYGETCASVALMMFARRMEHHQHAAVYADVMERAFYNAVIGSMDLGGTHFFYVNPLEVDPKRSVANVGHHHVLPVRPPWFACACCPPNLARAVAGIGGYVAGEGPNGLAVYLYGSFEAEAGGVAVSMEADYPLGGKIRFSVKAEPGKTLYLRLPGWCPSFTLARGGEALHPGVEHGFITLPGVASGAYELELAMPVRRVYANARVRQTLGQVCLQRGPLVYCLEERDNGPGLSQLVLPDAAGLHEEYLPDKLGGIVEVRARGYRLATKGGALYGYDADHYEKTPQELVFIPYYTWANRGENEMSVWVRRECEEAR